MKKLALALLAAFALCSTVPAQAEKAKTEKKEKKVDRAAEVRACMAKCKKGAGEDACLKACIPILD